jgi:hypothetical protein
MIREGRYAPGDQLPAEREIMEELGVGRSAVREAMLALQRMGLVTVSSGERARVTLPTAKVLVSELSGASNIATGVGFFDHMLTLLAKHGAFDLNVSAKGDLMVVAALALPGQASAVPPVTRVANINGQSYDAFTFGWRQEKLLSGVNVPILGIAATSKSGKQVLAVSPQFLRLLEPEELAAAQAKTVGAICGISGLAADSRHGRWASSFLTRSLLAMSLRHPNSIVRSQSPVMRPDWLRLP